MATEKTTKAVAIATRSNHNTEHATSLYARRETLCRTADGRYFVRTSGGPAMAQIGDRRLTRAEAVEWIAAEARDAVTGYGYTREQAEQMADGIDAGKGYRD